MGAASYFVLLFSAAPVHHTNLLCLPLHSLGGDEIDDEAEGHTRRKLLTANFWFMSAVHDRRYGAPGMDTPCCFHTLWPVLCLVAPLLRGRIRHLTQQDVDDLLFSLSRAYVRQGAFDV